MADQETLALVESIPFEIMCIIFDYLDIKSVKMCALVCRRWKEMIFSDYYIQRFRLSYHNRNEFFNYDQPCLVLKDHLYRHLKLWLEGEDFNTMNTVLRYPYLNQCITLELMHFAPENLKPMMDAIEQMGELRKLCISYRYWDNIEYQIRSSSLQFLSCINTLPNVVDTQNLNTFITKMGNNNIELLFSYRFPNLKHLEIESHTKWQEELERFAHARTFFAHHKELNTLILRAYVDEHIFTAICENYTHLEKLHIKEVLLCHDSAINHLSKLAKLNDLTLENVHGFSYDDDFIFFELMSVSFINVNLPQLKTLGIGPFRMQYQTLEAFGSVTKLKLFHESYSIEFISTVASKMPLLREIEFTTRVHLDFLKVIPSVEVIVFSKQKLDYLLNVFRDPMNNIKEICCMPSSRKPTKATFASLLELFPNLRVLKCGGSLYKMNCIEM